MNGFKNSIDSFNTSQVKIDTLGTIKPIKPIQSFSFTSGEWLIGAFLIFSFVFLVRWIYQLIKRKPKKEKLSPVHSDPFFWAESEIQKIISNPQLNHAPYKGYFIGISETIREFVHKITPIDAPRNTSQTVLEAFQNLNKNDPSLEKMLHELLRIADRVKFTQSEPNQELAREYGKVALDFIRKNRK